MSYFNNMVRPCLLDRLRATQVTGIRPNYIYGLLYNWYAITDNRIANSGFDSPNNSDYIGLIDYVNASYNVAPNNFGVGNHLKSCRQVSSPLGGDCATDIHPRWNANANNWGRDTLKMGLLPGGYRKDGIFFDAPTGTILGTKTIVTGSETNYITRLLASTNNNVLTRSFEKFADGTRIRLTRLATPSELLIPEGTIIPIYYKGNNNFLYDCVRINDRIWLAQNLAETKWSDGTPIPFAGVNGVNFSNAEWDALTTPAQCAYNNDVSTWAYTLP